MKEQLSELMRRVKRRFWTMTAAAAGLIILAYGLHRSGIEAAPATGLRAWGIVLLLVSVTLGAALPILIRTLFNRRAVERKQVSFEEFSAYQLSLLAVSISAAYAGAAAYLLTVPQLYLYGSILAGLYGIYSAIPSERKLAGEMRYYGLLAK